MKRILIMSIVLFFSYRAFADEIYLKNRQTRTGRIIQISNGIIEYDPEGPQLFETLSTDEVIKVIYDNGKIVQFSFDLIHYNDGKRVKGTVLKIEKDTIIFIPENLNVKKTVVRSTLEKIELCDGTIINLKVEIEDKERIYKKSRMRGFHESIVRINGFFGFGSPMGGVFNKERKLFDVYKFDLFAAYIIPRDYSIDNSSISGGGELDIMPPSIKVKPKRKFDFTGIKFGLRGRYGYKLIENIISDNDFYFSNTGGYERFREKFMKYHYWAAGPVINFVFSPTNKIFDLLLQLYVLGGHIFKGTVMAPGALRDARLLSLRMSGSYGTPFFQLAHFIQSKQFNQIRFQGATILAGVGPHISLNKFAPITLGVNITYTHSIIKLNRSLPVYYDGTTRYRHHDIGGEICAGFHF